MKLEVAAKAFIKVRGLRSIDLINTHMRAHTHTQTHTHTHTHTHKVRDMRSIDLINRIKVSRRLPGHSDQVLPITRLECSRL